VERKTDLVELAATERTISAEYLGILPNDAILNICERSSHCGITLACPIRESKGGVETLSRSFSTINQSVNVTFVSGAVLTVHETVTIMMQRRQGAREQFLSVM
jgi:hypothetical protein